MSPAFVLTFPDGFPAYHIDPPPIHKPWIGYWLLLFEAEDQHSIRLHIKDPSKIETLLTKYGLAGYQPAQMMRNPDYTEGEREKRDLELEASLGPRLAAIREYSALKSEADAPSSAKSPEPEPRKPLEIGPAMYQLGNMEQIPRRDWLYGKFLQRGNISLTVAPGGVGKSTLTLTEALALVTGWDLLGVGNLKRLKVWCWNGEDSIDELGRRLHAACHRYGIDYGDIGNRLYVNSGMDLPISIASQGSRDGAQLNQMQINSIIRQVKKRGIDVVIVDPFVSTHSVSENDNGAINLVAKTWVEIAQKANCAVHLVHHSRKGTRGEPTDVEHARGASALLAAVRTARSLNVMSEDEAVKANVSDRFAHVSITDGKANQSPLTAYKSWIRLEGVSLQNGSGGLIDDSDWVGVAVPWTWPAKSMGTSPELVEAVLTALGEGGPWLANARSPKWVGHPVAKAMELNIEDRAQKKRITKQIETWLEDGFFIETESRTADSKIVKTIEIGVVPC